MRYCAIGSQVGAIALFVAGVAMYSNLNSVRSLAVMSAHVPPITVSQLLAEAQQPASSTDPTQMPASSEQPALETTGISAQDIQTQEFQRRRDAVLQQEESSLRLQRGEDTVQIRQPDSGQPVPGSTQ